MAASSNSEWKGLTAEGLEAQLASLGLCLNKPEPAIICTRCKYALKPSGDGIAKHPGEKHGVPSQARRGLKAFVSSLQLKDPNKLELREDGRPPHPHLAIKLGVACRLCDFRSLNRDLAQRHMYTVHKQKGSQKSWLCDNIRSDLCLQSWTQNGPRGYWIAEADEQAALTETNPSIAYSSRRRARVAALHEEEHRRLAQLGQGYSTADSGTDDLALTSNWMRRTGWLVTFASADRCLLSLLDQSPAGDGQSLELGWYGTRTL